MNTQQLLNIGEQVEQWLSEEDQPQSARIKPISLYSGLYPRDAEECEAYWDFMSWVLSQDHVLLLSIPASEPESDFWSIQAIAMAQPDSAFNTVAYDREHPFQFDRYAYRVRKVYEQVKHLALLHSCISSGDSKINIHRRYQGLVAREFGEKLDTLREKLQNISPYADPVRLKSQIAKLEKSIAICGSIWRRYADS